MNKALGRPIGLPSLSPCEHLEVSALRRYTSPHTGKVSLRRQCLRCGMAQEIRPDGEVNAHDVAAYEPFDQGLTQRYLLGRWELFQVDQRRLALNPERRSPGWYREVYLKTTWWTTRRRRHLADAQGRCERCEKKAVHVHHRNYLRLFRERRQDLEALCWDCHRVADRERRRSRPTPIGQLRLLN